MKTNLIFRFWNGKKFRYSYDFDSLSEFFDCTIQENPVFQQYTGLKDKNKERIFDGDLILGNGYGPYRVFWDDDRAGWCSCCYGDADYIGGYETIEIVANIYETPDYEGVQ